MHSLAELDERRAIQPQIGNVAADRFLDDGLGGRPECRSFAADDEPLQLLVEVKLRIGDDQMVDQPDCELTGGKPERFVVVGVDHVVTATITHKLTGITEPKVEDTQMIKLQGDVLGNMADPGALV